MLKTGTRFMAITLILVVLMSTSFSFAVGRITGYVVDPEGDPVKSVVEIRDSEGKRITDPITDEKGYFDRGHEDIIVGEYDDLVAQPYTSSFVYQSVTKRVYMDETVVKNVYLQYEAPPSFGAPQFNLEVYKPDGVTRYQPVEGESFDIEVRYPEGQRVNSKDYHITEEDNSFAFYGLGQSIYHIRLEINASQRYTNPDEIKIQIDNSGNLTKVNDEEVLDGIVRIVLNEPQVKGQVLDPNGNPVDGGVGVFAVDDYGEQVAMSNVNSTGNYYLGGLDDTKSYRVYAQAYGQPYVSVNTEINMASKTPGEPLIHDITLKAPQIKGYVTIPTEGGEKDFDGHGAIYIVTPKGERIWSNFNGNDFYINHDLEDGRYLLELVPGEEFTQFIKPKPIAVHIKDGVSRAETLQITLEESTFTGEILLPYTNGAAMYSTITIVDIKNNKWVDSFKASQHGGFAVGDLRRGAYRFIVNPDPRYSQGYAGTTFTLEIGKDGRILNNDADDVTIERDVDGKDHIKIYLDTPLAIGKVYEEDNELARSGRVYLYDAEDYSYIDSMRVHNGEFYIAKGLVGEDGEYIVRAYPNNRYSSYLPSDEVRFTVSSGEINQAIKLHLNKIQLQGNIVANNENRNIRGYVVVTDEAGGTVLTTSIQEGEYRIGGLDNGEYYLTAYINQQRFSRSIPVKVNIREGQAILKQDILLGSKQLGLMIKQNENLVPEALVEVEELQEEKWRFQGALYAKDGALDIDGLGVGTYRIRAWKGYSTNFEATEYIEFQVKDNGVVEILEGSTEFIDDNLLLSY